MTTDEIAAEEYGEELTDRELVDLLGDTRRLIKQQRDIQDRLEQEVRRRCEALNATVLRGDTVIAKLKSPPPTYDYGKLAAILGLVEQGDLAKAYEPEHEETAIVPAKWNGTQLRKIEREYGGEVAGYIKGARIEGSPRLVIEERKQDET